MEIAWKWHTIMGKIYNKFQWYCYMEVVLADLKILLLDTLIILPKGVNLHRIHFVNYSLYYIWCNLLHCMLFCTFQTKHYVNSSNSSLQEIKPFTESHLDNKGQIWYSKSRYFFSKPHAFLRYLKSTWELQGSYLPVLWSPLLVPSLQAWPFLYYGTFSLLCYMDF